MDAIVGVRKLPDGCGALHLIYRSLVRALITSAALAAGVLLAGCNSDEISLATNAKANQPVPPKLIADMTEKDMDLQFADPGPAVQAGGRARGLEAGSLRPLCAAEDLSDLPLVGRSRTQGPRRRPPGAGRLLFHFAGADESAVGLLPLLQHRLSQRLRPGAGPHRLAADGAWRLLLARLLRHDRRTDRRNLFAGARILLRRPDARSSCRPIRSR